jgi:hypothetical protein
MAEFQDLGLSSDEDDLLRRLHWFESTGGELSASQRELKATLRGRDRRAEIRVPRQLARVTDLPPAEPQPQT